MAQPPWSAADGVELARMAYFPSSFSNEVDGAGLADVEDRIVDPVE